MSETMFPLVHELHPVPDPAAAFERLQSRPHCLFLDSALRDPTLGRYSFLTADPFAIWRHEVGCIDPFPQLQAELSLFQAVTVPDLPPFQGGLAGLLSYDLNRSLERIAPPRFDEFQLPAVLLGLYDTVVAWDHHQNRAWLISHGWPEQTSDARHQRATQRLQQFRDWLQAPLHLSTPSAMQQSLSRDELAPQFEIPGKHGLSSCFSPADYRKQAQRCIDYIFAGDVFQVNFAQRLLFPAVDSAAELYLRLRQRNAATFAGYFNGGTFQIASASPERLVQVREGRVEARPIKGTRRRTFAPEADLFRGDELRESEKDRAENIMIVDLLRNDLSQVCDAESVHVSRLCGLEVYEYVQHLVSVVEGRLAADKHPLELLRAIFPGGSITGAPKVRAMEIIAEMEPVARGAYCGSLGYVGFDGSLDFNILIRTITAARGWWQLPVGGGIVAQSQVEREYEETWHKAEGLIRSLLP
jgi:para-aminobenzoate synthetase component I